MSNSLSIISKFPSFLPSLFRGLDADPLYINELDTINSLLHQDSLFLYSHNERMKLRVSAVDPK